MDIAYHKPVMLEEVVSLLRCRPGGIYVDGTLGGGGHAHEILRRTAPDGVLVGIDSDIGAIDESRRRLKEFGDRVFFVTGNFADIAHIVRRLDIPRVDGIIFDLGVSSRQLDEAERGFSFSRDAPLDMRMDRDGAVTACDIVNHYSEEYLVRIFREYGEEMKAGKIARFIVAERACTPIKTTGQLAALVKRAASGYRTRSRRHPATRVFQALRIAVNDELTSVNRGIEEGIDILKQGGVISVISFHSLEDRIVKNVFRSWERGCICPPHVPQCVCGRERKVTIITKKPLVPGEDEMRQNPRARSAKLRAAERI